MKKFKDVFSLFLFQSQHAEFVILSTSSLSIQLFSSVIVYFLLNCILPYYVLSVVAPTMSGISIVLPPEKKVIDLN